MKVSNPLFAKKMEAGLFQNGIRELKYAELSHRKGHLFILFYSPGMNTDERIDI